MNVLGLPLEDSPMARIRHLLQEINPDPILVRDGNGRILYVNLAFAEVFGVSDKSSHGQMDMEVLPKDLLVQLFEVEQRALSTGSLAEHQYDVRRDDTTHSYLIRQVGHPDDDPAAAIACTVFRDISDRVDSVRQMQLLKEQAEAASLIKSRFLANMSHELRTPLNSIIGYSELLLEDSKQDWEQLNDLARIRRAGADLLRLVDEVLDFSRLEASKTDVYYETVKTDEFIRDLKMVIEPLATRGGNDLVLNLERAPEVVCTDLTKLEKILLALLNNACKFTHGGTITLTVDVSDDGSDRWISFQVADTGIGIPSSELVTIFDPFRQIDESSTRNYGGSGLGLNIGQQFSKLLGGEIRVDSKPGKGSTFVLRIPEVRQEMAVSREEGGRDIKGDTGPLSERPIVLVIEDNPEASDLISRHLIRQGCRVASAMDGIAGKDMAVDLAPDLITLALDMQFIDGWTVLQHLKADSRTRDIPVVICSNMDERKRAFAQGVTGYIVKPITEAMVRDALMGISGIKEKLNPA